MNLFNFKKKKCKIIAEVGQLHDGKIKNAHNIIERLAKTKVDAIKFQTHYAEEESTLKEPWRIKFSKKDKTRYDYWKRMEFSQKQWWELKKHCEKYKIEFLSSPFSKKAVDILNEVGIKYFKLASGEINNPFLIKELIKTKKPVLISTGMSNFKEIDKIVKQFKRTKIKFCLLQCTSKYPSNAKDLGLNNIKIFKERYKCLTGLSDHSGNLFSSLAAISLNANFVEVHVTYSKNHFSPDSSSSLTFQEIGELVKGRNYISEIINNPVNKNKLDKVLIKHRKIFTKSVVLNKDLDKNHKIKLSDLSLKKPNIGINADSIGKVLGKKLIKKMKKNTFLQLHHLKKYD
jgi:N,N'-diacetyllegionaminate synthase